VDDRLLHRQRRVVLEEERVARSVQQLGPGEALRSGERLAGERIEQKQEAAVSAVRQPTRTALQRSPCGPSRAPTAG